MTPTVIHGDCITVMAEMPASSVDAVVTDPPYGLGFMGHVWDRPGDRSAVSAAHGYGSGFAEPHPAMEAGRYDLSLRGNARFQQWCEQWATEALRVLKPGGHLLSFGGTRTFHRLTCAIEDAGFEIRDCLSWLYGSGFPKSLDVSKAIDKAAGAEREVVGPSPWDARKPNGSAGVASVGLSASAGGGDVTAPATPEAKRWQGWGTALKPAWEPIVLARKPLAGTVAANVLAHGTGALNVDGCRIPTDWVAERGETWLRSGRQAQPRAQPWQGPREEARGSTVADRVSEGGRWPANVVLDEDAAGALDEQSGETSYNPPGAFGVQREDGAGNTIYGDLKSPGKAIFGYGDTGGASRFFYCAKASSADRGPGNNHPTVKPTNLMRWLVRLVTPPGGTILDPFAGSGTTLIAATIEGFDSIGIEQEAEYVEIIERRLARPIEPVLDLGGVA